MSAAKSGKSAIDKAFAELLAGSTPEVRDRAQKTRALARKLLPDAEEEVDVPAKMIVERYIPRTYKGAIVAIAPQKSYVNINFPRGVELMSLDEKKLLEGTGKLARHVKICSADQPKEPALHVLIKEAH